MQLKEDVTTTTAVTMVTTTTIVLIHVIVVARQHLHVEIEAHVVRDMPMKGNVTDTLVVLIHITTTIVQFLATSVRFTPQLLNHYHLSAPITSSCLVQAGREHMDQEVTVIGVVEEETTLDLPGTE